MEPFVRTKGFFLPVQTRECRAFNALLDFEFMHMW